ncbi:hypothetical protein BU24DRAFT_423283 [Aaosphaeria arxii CBS 175.79]|uniref:Zn(2)-C6 fungal-type domain-containing protein n=1 Tax=Aaosphaeria arxii CBS 175.79 TaxID=1450172 RepID=A0A6A5XM04_9PLEO|nr:uncharacterized protein BU24DRAFT_423283 [Aaosphaeria arxii CBS 175.79]KAF2014288.1 hypothetical protein BU24DRAFT_423283 [Aaosphaeria arxii CBS 175.79]
MNPSHSRNDGKHTIDDDNVNNNTKVAIPRLTTQSHQVKSAQSPTTGRSSAARYRTTKACHNCRRRKIRCSGTTPCRYCLEQDVECEYQPGRRDRLRDATDRVESLSSLLRDLARRGLLGEDDQRKVEELLAPEVEDGGKDGRFGGETASSSTHSRFSTNPSERNAPESVGSNEHAYQFDGDPAGAHDLPATGLGGQGPRWHQESKTYISTGNNAPVSDFTFYLDGDHLDINVNVEHDLLPLPGTAQRLVAAYMTNIHNQFPIVPRELQEQLVIYIQAAKRQGFYEDISYNVRAILNLILAIGAKFSHLIQAPLRADELDHNLYMNRAIKLMELHAGGSILVCNPDLLSVESTGLLALYYVVTGHVNRSWVVIGTSLRCAIAIGLNLCNDDASTCEENKTSLARSWWGLYSIECLLSSLTGRPTLIGIENCSFQSHGPHSGNMTSDVSIMMESGPGQNMTSGTSHTSFLDSQIRVGFILQKAQVLLYSPKAQAQTWEQIQSSIRSLSSEVDRWALAALPNGVVGPDVFDRSVADRDALREQYILSFHVQSAKILLSRPCLCHINQRYHDTDPNQSERSNEFDQEMKKYCLIAAIGVAQLLPDHMDLTWLYQNGPWWSIVHNIMQAATILLLELTLEPTFLEVFHATIRTSFRKLVLRLRAMHEENIVGKNAYDIIFNMIRSSLPHVQADLNDLFEEDEQQRPILPSPIVGEKPVSAPAPIDWTFHRHDTSSKFPLTYSSEILSNGFPAPDLNRAHLNPCMESFYSAGTLGATAMGAPTGNSTMGSTYDQMDGFGRATTSPHYQEPYLQNLKPNWPSNFSVSAAPVSNENMEDDWNSTFDQAIGNTLPHSSQP